ncbi:hypothetical protein B0H14DRAFT_3770225 [Mycena olivaceomarginata]|nr:hypothetical protein B0H14DRAFT_3770225 [Mycena olivaceomarginata]
MQPVILVFHNPCHSIRRNTTSQYGQCCSAATTTLCGSMNDIATLMPTATMYALSPTLPKIFGDATPLSHPDPPFLSFPAALLEFVVLHFATRPPTRPSANTTLGIESRLQSGIASPGSTPFSVDICWLLVALVFIQRPDAAIMCIAARIFDA